MKQSVNKCRYINFCNLSADVGHMVFLTSVSINQLVCLFAVNERLKSAPRRQNINGVKFCEHLPWIHTYPTKKSLLRWSFTSHCFLSLLQKIVVLFIFSFSFHQTCSLLSLFLSFSYHCFSFCLSLFKLITLSLLCLFLISLFFSLQLVCLFVLLSHLITLPCVISLSHLVDIFFCLLFIFSLLLIFSLLPTILCISLLFSLLSLFLMLFVLSLIYLLNVSLCVVYFSSRFSLPSSIVPNE